MISAQDIAAHLGIPYGQVPTQDAELTRYLRAAVGRVEAMCGPLGSDLAPGRTAALELAVLVIVRHSWETRRGRSPRPGRVPSDDLTQSVARDGIPRAAWDYMSPYLLPVIA